MKKHHVKIVSLLAGTVMLLTATGCGNGAEGSVHLVDGSVTTAQEETQAKPHVDVYTGIIGGEEVTSKDIYATVDKVYLSDYTFTENEQEIGLLFYQITIRNEAEEEISANFLSQSFGIAADGEGYAGVTLRGPRFIAREFGDGTEDFTDPITPGETRQGYVCVEIPADFQVATLTYFPAAGLVDWSEAFTFDTAREDMEPAPTPVTDLNS